MEGNILEHGENKCKQDGGMRKHGENKLDHAEKNKTNIQKFLREEREAGAHEDGVENMGAAWENICKVPYKESY